MWCPRKLFSVSFAIQNYAASIFWICIIKGLPANPLMAITLTGGLGGRDVKGVI